MQEVTELFSYFDKDGSGQISFDEFLVAYEYVTCFGFVFIIINPCLHKIIIIIIIIININIIITNEQGCSLIE